MGPHVGILREEAHESRENDLGSERQRRDDRPGGERSIVRSVRDAARAIIVESPQAAANPANSRPGTVARRDSPDVARVPLEIAGIALCVTLLDDRRAAAVLEIVDPLFSHEVVADSAEIDPEVGKLMHEERTAEEVFDAEVPLPLVGRGP